MSNCEPVGPNAAPRSTGPARPGCPSSQCRQRYELQLLVAVGLTLVQALRAATSTPSHRFGLTDPGRIVAGAQADLLLVDGDPTTTISSTLSIRAVWRRGVVQAAAA
jgi:imidazolonepropionase-like amidohydrolase